MKAGKNDKLIAAIVMIVAGGFLTLSGVMAFVELACHNPGLSRFLLGYSLLVSGIAIIGQLRYLKTIADMVRTISMMKTKQEAEQVADGNGGQAP